MVNGASIVLIVCVGVGCAQAAVGQSINIDLSSPLDPTPSSYGAAGQVGYWNTILAAHNTYTHNLKGLDGVATPVRLWQYGGTALLNSDDSSTSGPDDALLDDCLVTYTQSLETCLFFDFLDPGPYEVIIYAWMPNQPTIHGYTSVDEEPGNPHHEVGGVFTGQHQEGVTYSRHLAMVGPDGRLRTHSGIVPGASEAAGAPMNGIQIRRIITCPGDVVPQPVIDGVVGIADLLEVIGSWGACPAPPEPCSCDVNSDQIVGIGDLLTVIGNWGQCR